MREPESIEPPGSLSPGEPRRPSVAPPRNRADLVLLLGLLSLCLCWPVGLVAWILGRTDLRRIEAGQVSRERVGVLKLGMGLGVVGMALFVATVVIALISPPRIPGLADLHKLFKPSPLPAHQIAYVGEWHGNQGTFIQVHPDGRGDFKTRNSSVTGGVVTIEERMLSIGFLGLSRTWHVDVSPHVKDGVWVMELDGEKFMRRGQGPDMVI
ncbi:MAG: hypothetical protein AB1473_08605 [Thermodesulfobacteriota bacterium]